MDFKDLLKKSEKDLHDMLKSFREQVRALRFSIGSDQEKNVRKLRSIKKDIAKILTILNKKTKDLPDEALAESEMKNKGTGELKIEEPKTKESENADNQENKKSPVLRSSKNEGGRKQEIKKTDESKNKETKKI